MIDQEQNNESLEETLQEDVPEQDASPESTSTEQESESQLNPQTPVESQKEINIRLLRESKERVERERDELLRRLDGIERQMQKPAQPAQEEEKISYSPDDLIEGRHLSQYEKKLLKLEQQLQNYQQQSTAMTVETKLKTQYSDFDSVVTKDNLELLRLTYPELANSINSTNDLYSKAVSAYTMIKNLGIQQSNTFDAEKNIAKANTSKPRPLASVSPQQGDSPLSKANAFANGLTDDLKAQLYKEMLEAMKKSN